MEGGAEWRESMSVDCSEGVQPACLTHAPNMNPRRCQLQNIGISNLTNDGLSDSTYLDAAFSHGSILYGETSNLRGCTRWNIGFITLY